jgi:Flp pilus assembly protein TadD
MHRRARALALAATLALASAQAAAAPAAEVVSVEGKGEYREAQQATWRAVAAKQPLFPSNFVRTLDQSKMAIVFVDRTQVRLAPNSTMQIKEVASGTDTRTILNLNQGRSWTQSKTTPRGLTMETPSALAAIRGTDWEMVVDEEGRATLTVFSGEVEFYNDQGNVVVRPNEQARAEKGRAPVKLLLQTSRDRMQWVSSFTIDPQRYAEFRAPLVPDLRDIAKLLREQSFGDAYARLKALALTADAPAVVHLLLADFEIYRGDLDRAAQVLAGSAGRYPSDERFEVGLARVALLHGDAPAALAHARAALAKRPDSADALVMLGDIERYEGRAPQAIEAYARAVGVAANDARAWFGRGVVEEERENVRRARSDLSKAIALDETDAGYRAELGMLEGFAGDSERGREHLEKALALQPDNYVALTGLGVLELRSGHVDAAVDALLRAGVVEPRYARAHLYLAAAYYQAGRDDAAQAELKRAGETDPNDPLPHLLASMIHLDRIEPGLAVAEARLALDRIPYLKSLNQVADSQKGIANVGSPLAFMGLEEWARSAAQDSYLPFWGASHLFLADRYAGDFDRRSELMQGFITDPLAFGASNRFQSLLTQPGHHATASLRYNSSDDLRLVEPVITLNGLVTSPRPAAYFVEAVDTQIDPRNTALSARAKTLTAAVGAKPTAELSTFLYANRLSVDADLGQRGATGDFERINGTATRVDGGLSYAFDAASRLWLKAGASDQHSTVDDALTLVLPGQPLVSASNFVTRPSSNDVSLRYTLVARDSLEVTAGIERARLRTPRTLVRDAGLHFDTASVPQESLDQVDHDRSESAYGMARWTAGALRLDVGIAWSDYRKDRDIATHQLAGDFHVEEAYRRKKADPLAGLTWRLAPSSLVRAACRRWARPISLDTLAPIAVAGIPLDDQLVFPGGVLDECRGQFEWNDASKTFFNAYAERSRVHNLVSALDGVQNTNADVTNLDRLRNRALAPPPKPDSLEDTPVYGEGIVKRAGLAIERIVTAQVAMRAQYTYTDSENTNPALSGRSIPYLPRHQANLGATWAPGWHAFVTAQAVYRSRRFADELNVSPLPPGWDAQLNVFIESPDKRWSVEAYGMNLLKKESSDVFGIVVSYRY